jgi:predicted dehydrogenase
MGATGTDRELRYGVVGVGMMGQEHLRNLAALPGVSPVAAADPHEPSLAAARACVPGPLATYPDLPSMLRAEPLDAVVVATPNHTHHRVLEPVWDTDVHVMVEKPVCHTLDDALALRRRARTHRGVVWVGLEYRFMPAVDRFVDLVRTERAAGRVHMVSIREHRYPFLVKVGDWNRFNANTGGTLVEKCCHFFDLMRLVTPGAPVRVMASGAQDVNHLDERYDGRVPDICDNAFVIVEFDSGARALLDLCMFAEGSAFEQELVAVGDAGKVEAQVPGFMELARGRRPQVTVGSRGPDWPVRTEVLEPDPAIAYEGAHHGASYLEHVAFRDAVLAGDRPEVSVDDGVWSVALGVAAHRSIDERRAVEVAELGLPADL